MIRNHYYQLQEPTFNHDTKIFIRTEISGIWHLNFQFSFQGIFMQNVYLRGIELTWTHQMIN